MVIGRSLSSRILSGAFVIGWLGGVLADDMTATASTPPPERSRLVTELVSRVSAAEITSSLKRLESFGTRHTYSEELGPDRGIGAARQWIAERFRAASPKLSVRFDAHRVAAKPPRLFRDLNLHNVVAVLPAASADGRERNFIISAHYDSVAAGPDGRISWDRPDTPAPGVNDDGSGTALVLEAARVLAGSSFDANIVFIAFAGEEQGLVGSTLFARAARRDGMRIDGVFNNDIVGGERGGDGRSDNRTVRVFSAGPENSPSREMARLIDELARRYVPDMGVDLVFRHDRFGRGGDHTPFNQEGYAGVRFTVSNEDYSRQHTVADTFDGASADYAARTARINIAALATVALAPPAPVVFDPRGRPMIDRGESGYDCRLRWKPGGAGEVAGYRVLMRETTSPVWQRSYWAGNTEEFLLPGVSIDRHTFGVRAVDSEGHESLASVYFYPPRPPAEYHVLPSGE